MNIQVRWCPTDNKWKYTVIDDSRPILRQESGEREELWEALNDVKTLAYKLFR